MIRSISKWMCRVGIVVAVLGAFGCSSKDVRNEVVAQVGGEEIRVGEFREFLGIRGGNVDASEFPPERKKEALDRFIAGRLLVQDARAKGLDNTDEFRKILKDNETDVMVSALFNMEMDAKGKVAEKEVAEHAKRLREADNTLSEKDAPVKAKRALLEKSARTIEEQLIAEAKKETPSVIDRPAVERIGKGEAVSDDTVLATVGGEKITYGTVKALLGSASSEAHSGKDFIRNPVAIGRMLDREVAGKVLVAYAKKKGVEKTEWMKKARADFERTVLINLLAEKVVLKGIAVTEKDIADTYKEHEAMFVKDGKKVPFSEVKGQIQAFLVNDRRKKAMEAYVVELRKKAKITVNEATLPKV